MTAQVSRREAARFKFDQTVEWVRETYPTLAIEPTEYKERQRGAYFYLHVYDPARSGASRSHKLRRVASFAAKEATLVAWGYAESDGGWALNIDFGFYPRFKSQSEDPT